jgi:hypothetical protein
MSEEVQRVEVITSVQRRRRWSVAEKIRLVEEPLEPGMSGRWMHLTRTIDRGNDWYSERVVDPAHRRGGASVRGAA